MRIEGQMISIEIEITAISEDRISVRVDYERHTAPIVRKWYADRAVIDSIYRDLHEILTLGLQETLTDREARDETEESSRRIESLGLAFFQEIFKEEADNLRDLIGTDEECCLIFKIDRSLAYLPLELLYDGKRFISQHSAVGRVIISEGGESPPSFERRPPYRILVVGDPSEDPAIRDDVENEIDVVKGVLANTKNISLRAVMGNEADQKFILANLPGSMIFHFTGHGVVSETEDGSGIKLGGGKVLSGETIKGLQNPPALAFLNMCTAASEQAWRTSLGLVEMLLRRGTRVCIAALWDLRSGSAALMGSRFYRYLIQGDSFGQALRKARSDTADSFGLHDLTWAAYALYGDPRLGLTAAEAGTPERGRVRRRVALIAAILMLIAFVLFPLPTDREEFIRESPVAVGYLLLESEPDDAAILIDGREVGVTPYTVEIGVGTHRIALEKEGYKRWEASVEVKRSPRTVVQAVLEKLE